MSENGKKDIKENIHVQKDGKVVEKKSEIESQNNNNNNLEVELSLKVDLYLEEDDKSSSS